VAEDQEMVQPALITHGAESQQRSEGFACPGAGKHQQVAAAALELEPAPQQLNQLLLPLPWLNLAGLDLVRGLPGREVEADG
jgi:hypothetical protein